MSTVEPPGAREREHGEIKAARPGRSRLGLNTLQKVLTDCLGRVSGVLLLERGSRAAEPNNGRVSQRRAE